MEDFHQVRQQVTPLHFIHLTTSFHVIKVLLIDLAGRVVVGYELLASKRVSG
jgi:hypothetical protein